MSSALYKEFNGFGQGVIVGVTGRTYRRYCLATGESLPVAHVAVLHAPIGVVHEPTSVYIIAATLVDRHVQRVQATSVCSEDATFQPKILREHTSVTKAT